MSFLIIGVIFIFLFALILLAMSGGTKFLEAARTKEVSDLLRDTPGEAPLRETRILSEAGDGRNPGLWERLSQLPVLKSLQRQVWQAGLDWPATQLVGISLGCAVLGGLLGFLVRVPFFREMAVAGLACLLGALPYLFVRFKRGKRLREFEALFPEALDFLARAMRAGHAFSVSLEMLGDESNEPLAGEFRRVFHEQNLGSPVEDALRNLAERVPLLDVRFFVSAVLMQRETGGNLAEILNKLSYIIRERFRLKGQVRAASAHGRLTAGVLTALPLLTAVGLMLTSPGYLGTLAREREGRYMIAGALAGQALGYYFMRRIVNIKV
ncbi:MAG: type II secretion system F family protein [Bryobacterales bacterium]|nr:type II secretion system F family protein [Bryobacterales bacterium]